MTDYSAADIARFNAYVKSCAFKNIKTADDVARLQSSGVSIFGGQKLTEEEQNEAYKVYSQTLLEDYYDADGDKSVSVDEFAKREQETLQKTNNVIKKYHENRIKSIDKGLDNFLKTSKELNNHIKDLEKNKNALAFLDTDFDGKISHDEFLKNGIHQKAEDYRQLINPYKEERQEHEKIIADLNSDKTQLSFERHAKLFAQNLDYNENGKIDEEEHTFFVKTADDLTIEKAGKKYKQAKDGKIFGVQEGMMFNSIVGANANNKEYNKVINKYLDGETLTSQEQQIFDKAQKEIRANIKKAAESEE